MKLTIHKTNEAVVVAVLDELLARLGWSAGDVVEAEVVGDALRLVRIETAFDSTMRMADEITDDYSWTLEQLART